MTSQILTIHQILEDIREKKNGGNNIICQLLQGFLLHTQKEDEVNTTYQQATQRNRCSHNDAI